MLKSPEYPPIEFEERQTETDALSAIRLGLIQEYEKKKADFNDHFNSLLQREIHPALHHFLDQVRAQGHHLELDAATFERFQFFLHRSYSVRMAGRSSPVVFTFAANYDHRKIFVYTEYNASTTINVYDPAQINEPLLERIVLKGLGKIVAHDLS